MSAPSTSLRQVTTPGAHLERKGAVSKTILFAQTCFIFGTIILEYT